MQSLLDVPGIGQAAVKQLESLDIYRPIDLLFHLPQQFEDRTRVTELASLEVQCEALICAMVVNVKTIPGRMLAVDVEDDTGGITLRFFRFNRYQVQRFQKGGWVAAYGTTKAGSWGFDMVHPSYRQFDERPNDAQITDKNLQPIYKVVKGISQQKLRSWIEYALHHVEKLVMDPFENIELPPYFDQNLLDSLKAMHRPEKVDAIDLIKEKKHPVQLRLALEELAAYRVGLLDLKHKRLEQKAFAAPRESTYAHSIKSKLPWSLTNAQQRVLEEVGADISNGYPALRLVQGDVGSGKTIVAALACAQMVEAGAQVAVMAPTELLAEQHFSSFQQWFEPLGVRVGWFSGVLTAKERRDNEAALKEGEINIAVGTHALFQNSIEFAQLGLVVVDEQHRFGVDQRNRLFEKAKSAWNMVPHRILMTATPIPRTLAMSLYADLEISNIDELPPGRKPISTVVMAQSKRKEVIERIQVACDNGAQAYWVCPLIEESENLNAQAVTLVFEELSRSLKNVAIGLVHGRMKSIDKDAVMQRFRSGQIKLLVATTVIEVGVDVPSATLMIIENAERLGLAQLHQLRGRVGRSAQKSVCLLLYQFARGTAKERLNIMRESQDGFVIAEKDLELRGPGDILGTQQTGATRLRVADMVTHADLLPLVATIVEQLDAPTKELLRSRWLEKDGEYVYV